METKEDGNEALPATAIPTTPAASSSPPSHAQTTTSHTSYEDLVRKGALLRRWNQELNRQNKTLASDADAVLASSSATGPTPSGAMSSRATSRLSRPPSTSTRAASAGSNRRPSSPRVGGGGSTTFGGGKAARSPTAVTVPSAVSTEPTSGRAMADEVNPSDGTSPVQVDEDGLSLEGVGSEATIRIQRARIHVLQQQLKESQEEVTTVSKKVTEMESELKSVMEERRRLSLKVKSLEAAVEKEAKVKAEKEVSSAQRRQQANALEKQVATLKKANKQLETENKTKEVRLNRALEEVERLKGTIQKERSSMKDDTVQERKEMDKLTADVRRLERQKAELLAAFRKQMQLIDLLRRQKLHIEAARLLSFTEEEFTSLLNGGVEWKM